MLPPVKIGLKALIEGNIQHSSKEFTSENKTVVVDRKSKTRVVKPPTLFLHAKNLAWVRRKVASSEKRRRSRQQEPPTWRVLSRLPTSKATSPSCAHRRCGSPSARRGDTRVVSIANCAPWNAGCVFFGVQKSFFGYKMLFSGYKNCF